MANIEKLREWILNNKQVGKVFSFEKNGELCWSSVAIQKHEDVIKVYVDEILESQMDAENYLREELINFVNVDDAINYVSKETMVEINDLFPCRGQKIFNPLHEL